MNSTIPAPAPWYVDSGEIARLMRHLRDNGDLRELDDAIRLVEKPWHWTEEYESMCSEQDGGRIARDGAADAYEAREAIREYEEP